MIALVCLLAASDALAARTIVVDKEGGDFSTVAEASREAKPGDTVFIRAHADKLDAPGTFKPDVSYASDGGALETLELKGCVRLKLTGFRLAGLKIDGSKNVVVEKCRVEAGAVEVTGSSDVELRDCAIVKPDPARVPDRVVVKRSDKFALTGSLVVAAHHGVVLEDAANAVLKRNTIFGARYTGAPLDASDLAEAHDALTASAAVMIQCAPSMMEAWDKRKAAPAELAENVLASNERGILVDRCAKGNSSLKVHHNLFHDNGELNYVSVGKKYHGSSFEYALEDILAKGRMEDTGNKFTDPLLSDPAKGDYSLRGESPAGRMGKDGGAIGAAAEVARVNAPK